MKRRIALSIAIGLSVVLLALMHSDSTAKAQPGRVFAVDTGVFTLGPTQTLRITVANGLDQATVRFRRLSYIDGSCVAGVCKHIISSQTLSDPMTLAPGEAASYNLGDTLTHEVRSVVTSNREDLRVNAIVIDTTTNAIVSSFSWGLSNPCGGGC
jgi:hypothetical protein